MKVLCGIVLLLFPSVASSQIPDNIIGNWADPATNEWKYGFFEYFAVYKGDFWQYRSIDRKEKSCRLVISLGGDSVALQIEYGRGKKLKIAEGEGRYVSYDRIKNRLPHYTHTDTSFFREPFTSDDSVTIVGYYRNLDKVPASNPEFSRRVFSVTASNFLDNGEYDYITGMDGFGRFIMKFPVWGAKELYVDWQRLREMMVVEPGDRIFIYVDVLSLLPGYPGGYIPENPYKSVIFMGDNARINNELLEYEATANPISIYDPYIPLLTDREYLDLCHDMYYTRSVTLDSFINDYPCLSSKFRYYKRGYELWQFADNVSKRHFFRGKGIYGISPGYIDFMKDSFPLNDPVSWILFRELKSYMINYIAICDMRQHITASRPMHPLQITERLRESGRLTPDLERDLADFAGTIDFFETVGEQTDRESLAKEILNMRDRIFRSDAVSEMVADYELNRIFRRDLQLSDSLIENPRLKELWDAAVYYRRIDDSKRPLAGEVLEEARSRLTTPVLRRTVSELNEYYRELSAAPYDYGASLVSAEAFDGVTDGEELFRMLTEPYKGKVIYLDVWGTWCVPAREQMKYFRELTESLKGEDVVFLYLAHNSPHPVWEQMIKVYGITGENIFHYNLPGMQQAILERKLGVHHYPAYMLIDKNGKLAELSAPYPHDREKVKTMIDILLLEGEVYR